MKTQQMKAWLSRKYWILQKNSEGLDSEGIKDIFDQISKKIRQFLSNKNIEDKPKPLKIAFNFLKATDKFFRFMFYKKGDGKNKRWSE